VELGCGSGNDAIYLAGRGFDVTAIDIAPSALSQAEKKAKDAGVKVGWLHADVLNPPELEPFDLIYDRGCYHGVRRQNAAGYVATLRRLSRPGTQVLILAGNANEPPPHSGPPRVREADIRADFGPWFEFQWLRETRFDTTELDRKGALAWSILLRRKAEAPAAKPQ
jgi:SAM-dependent methyltransferase